MHICVIILLCIIQACTEYLPVSSTAHLVLISNWLDISHNNLSLDLALNLGTLLSTLVYFRKYIFTMFSEVKDIFFLKTISYTNLLITKLFIATIPVIIIGYLLIHYEMYEVIRTSSIILALCLIVFGVLLYIVDIICKNNISFDKITVKQSIFIGLFQCISLIPGVSRSGITITAARLQKIEKSSAVQFSFLLAIPSTLGAITLNSIYAIKNNVAFQYYEILISVLFTFIFGLIVIHLLLKFVTKHNFMIFMLYRVILGLLILYFI